MHLSSKTQRMEGLLEKVIEIRFTKASFEKLSKFIAVFTEPVDLQLKNTVISKTIESLKLAIFNNIQIVEYIKTGAMDDRLDEIIDYLATQT